MIIDMKLTKKEAILKTIKMWKWMSEQPDKTTKYMYFIRNHLKQVKNECYLCEYTSYHKSCPIFKTFGKPKHILHPDYLFCSYECENNLIYNKWRFSEELHLKENAKKIYLALLKFYKSKYGKIANE
uniref:Uncharacterized protein n=1 Tax=viral metagenome TaxID=1070528 RepID=A0A6H1ZS60_9ZZZZ